MFEENLVKILRNWPVAGPDGLQAALRICRDLVFFRPDPSELEKIERRKKNPLDFSARLNPGPRFPDLEYAQLLNDGVRPLAEAAPLATAKLLIEAVADMLVLERGHRPDSTDFRRNDASEIWSPRVDKQRHPYSDPKTDLIRTLTFACEQVYEKADATELQELDLALREGKWHVFDRIRYHLYAKFTAQSKDWIREAILNDQAYGTERYDFEFQRMIRIAVERFGISLLSNEQLAHIFELIINGPDKDDYRQFMGERFTEEVYRRRQDYFQFRQFRPFGPVLFGKYKERYESLAANAPKLTDDDFVRYGSGEAKTIVSRSPKTVAELAQLRDDELILLLNTWEEARRDSEEWWVEIDFTGLAGAFQQLIAANPNRFLNWGDQWQKLERPIYLRYALDAAGKRIAEHQSELAQWLHIADWIMSRGTALADTTDRTSETSQDRRDWSGARRQVVDFIGVCINKDVNIGLEWRPRIFELLKTACVAPDSYLDTNKPVTAPRDYLTDAINTMRGRALENLLQYGFWVRRHALDTDLSDVFEVIRLRLNGSPPLALAEYALLGASFYQLYSLNSSWAKENVSQILPQSKADAWAIAFGTYLRFNNAHPLVFDILKPQLDFAVEHLRSLQDEKNPRSDAVAHLGYHLVDYFIWGLIELDGSDSLLSRFYAKTKPDYWVELFDHLGRLLSRASALKPEMAERCKAFFEARLAEGNADELKELTFWLKAECLEPKWRLTAFLRTLEVTKGTGHTASMLVEDLAKLMSVEPDLVVVCFAKLTEGLVNQPYFYLHPEQVKQILKVGLSSHTEETVEAARFARDNLLKSGRSEYLNLD